jgi:hypothetical protein
VFDEQNLYQEDKKMARVFSNLDLSKGILPELDFPGNHTPSFIH